MTIPRLPLEGLLVADFSRVLAGPYAAMTLGDLGADVIKVERPGTGDDTRGWGPPWTNDGTATYFLGLNRNKRSITLDLSNSDDQALAVELARRADVLVENFRPGTFERYGLGYEQLRPINPGLVYCSITGFGAVTAEAAEMSGYDLMVQAMSGLMSITGSPDGQPIKVGVALVDHICALQSTIGIMAALASRASTGLGQRVEVSLLGSALAALLNQGSAFVNVGVVGARLGNRHPSIAPYQNFQASDSWFVLACGNDTQFVQVCAAIGQPELAADPRFSTNTQRVVNVETLDELLSAAFVQRPIEHWNAKFIELGVPSGPINNIDQAFSTATRLGLDPVEEFGRQRFVRSPIRLSETSPSVRNPAPALGEHSQEIRDWLLS